MHEQHTMPTGRPRQRGSGLPPATSHGRALGHVAAQLLTARPGCEGSTEQCDRRVLCSAGTSVPHYRLHEAAMSALRGFPHMFCKVFLMAAERRPAPAPNRAGKHSTPPAPRHGTFRSTIYIVNEKSWRAESGTACLQRRRSYVRDVKHRSVRTEQRGGVFQRGSAHTAEPCPFLSSPLPPAPPDRRGPPRGREAAARGRHARPATNLRVIIARAREGGRVLPQPARGLTNLASGCGAERGAPSR